MSNGGGAAHGIFADIPYPKRRAGARRALFLGISVISLAIFGVGFWAATVPLASAVIAPGQIVVFSKRKQVQHREGGTIGKINVRDGSTVTAGDILIELDDAEIKLRYSLARTAYYSALATKVRLNAEKSLLERLTFPKELTDAAAKDPSIDVLLQNQRDNFLARRNEKEGQIIVVRQRITQTAEEIHGYEAEIASTHEQSRIASTELELLKKLLLQGYTTRTRVVAIEREAAQLRGSAGKLTALIARARSSSDEARFRILQIKKQFHAEVLKNMTEIEDRIYDLREKSELAREKINKLLVRAPTSGVVVNMQIGTIGGVIQPGETILEIVPENDRLIIEARVRPVDIDQISVGLLTDVRITAFKQRTTQTLNGKVILVSADSLQDSRSGENYFFAHIEVIANQKTAASINRLLPGMVAEVLIKTGKRTALAYMVQPILDSVNRAMRER